MEKIIPKSDSMLLHPASEVDENITLAERAMRRKSSKSKLIKSDNYSAIVSFNILQSYQPIIIKSGGVTQIVPKDVSPYNPKSLINKANLLPEQVNAVNSPAKAMLRFSPQSTSEPVQFAPKVTLPIPRKENKGASHSVLKIENRTAKKETLPKTEGDKAFKNRVNRASRVAEHGDKLAVLEISNPDTRVFTEERKEPLPPAVAVEKLTKKDEPAPKIVTEQAFHTQMTRANFLVNHMDKSHVHKKQKTLTPSQPADITQPEGSSLSSDAVTYNFQHLPGNQSVKIQVSVHGQVALHPSSNVVQNLLLQKKGLKEISTEWVFSQEYANETDEKGESESDL